MDHASASARSASRTPSCLFARAFRAYLRTDDPAAIDPRSLLPQKSCRRRRQCHPLCRRPQLPTNPRMAEGAFAPIPDRVLAPLDQPINAQSGLLTDDYFEFERVISGQRLAGLRRPGMDFDSVPESPVELGPYRLITFYVSGNLMVETGHFPSCSLIEIRKPCNSSSQTFSTVPALPLVRATDLPISRERASSYALRIVAAWGTSTSQFP
jgi:hypothetical protein